jgi:hypothetical protein
VVIADTVLFGILPDTQVQGYLTVISGKTRITGMVRFQDQDRRQFSAALPLESQGRQEMWFSQVAEDAGYFTGLAVLNPNSLPAELAVSVFNPDGELAGMGHLTLRGLGRMSRLLREVVLALPGVNGGYFVVRSDLPLIGASVFGAPLQKALAAVPAQWIEPPPYAGAAPEDNYVRVRPDSDFSPPRGGVAGGPGPAMCRLMIARSQDGLRFERIRKIVCDQGAVPDLVVDVRGNLYLYYTAWVVGDEINKTVVAISPDSGNSWTFRKLGLQREEGESDLVDPDVLLLDDGTFRLYTTVSYMGQYARTHYADSADGIHFARKGIAFDPGSQALDPSAIKIGSTYHIFAGGVAGDPEANWHGVSQDAATYRFDRTMIFRVNGYGQMMANGLAVDGDYRYYGFGNDRNGGISSFFTRDGIGWVPDADYRLLAEVDSRLEDGQPTDPAVVRLPDGSYLMVYSTRIRN